jgi:Peptidase C13 family
MRPVLRRQFLQIAALLIGLLTLAATLAGAPAEPARKLTVVSFGLYGGEAVFRREATGAAEIVASRFGGDPVIVRYNTRKDATATIETLAATLASAAKRMDPATDVLFLILTSHGSPEGLAVSAGRRSRTLTPARLAEMLDRTGIRHKVVVISACYSGIFIPRLANPDTLVITAADADHPSFGCEDKAKWTYFGDALFNSALRQSATLKEAFTLARSLVLSWELRSGFEPSNPQIAGGENVEPLLVARQ